MLRHLFKHHLSKFDKFFLLFLVVLTGVDIYFQLWTGAIFNVFFAVFVIMLAAHKMINDHLSDLLDETLELMGTMAKGLEGRKIVETTTHEFKVEKITKEGKAKNEKSSNESKANAGRSRGGSSKKRNTGSKTTNAKRAGTASVQNRQSKNSKKDSQA